MKSIVHQTPEQRAIIDRALRLKGEMKIACEADFYRRVLQPHLGWSYSTWHRLREDVYQAKADRKIEELELALNVLMADRSEQCEDVAEDTYHQTRWWEEVKLSVEISAQRLCKERATMMVARAGFGKTATARRLVAWAKTATHGAKRLFPGGSYFRECDESWRSGKPVFEHLADMLGLVSTYRGMRDVTEPVIYEIKRRGAMFVALDECQYWSPHTVNAFKTLINRTPIVPFFDCTPDLLAQFRNKSWETWEQMNERVFRTVHIRSFQDGGGAGIGPGEVRPFLEALGVSGPADRMASEIADSANYAGGFGRVKAVIDVVVFKFRGVWTLDNVNAAIEEAERAKGINTRARRKIQASTRASAKQVEHVAAVV